MFKKSNVFYTIGNFKSGSRTTGSSIEISDNDEDKFRVGVVEYKMVNGREITDFKMKFHGHQN